MSSAIELRRAPGTCCPEPGCDHPDFDYSACPNCSRRCILCKRQPHYEYVETPVKCDACHARLFALARIFQRHLQRHRKIVWFICPVCDQELHFALRYLTTGDSSTRGLTSVEVEIGGEKRE